jgi:hypothetical protein
LGDHIRNDEKSALLSPKELRSAYNISVETPGGKKNIWEI